MLTDAHITSEDAKAVAVPRVGPRSGRRQPFRKCLASGVVRPTADLLRFVVAPDQTLVLDLSGRLPGRGLWLSPQRDMLEKACARNLFAKSAKTAVRVQADLVSQVESLIRERCLELLGLARRAGQAVAGFEKARAHLSSGRAALLIQARDAAEDGRAKLAALGRGVSRELKLVEQFDADELGRVFGRATVVHVAVAPGGLAERIVANCDHLAGIAGSSDGPNT